MRLSVRLARETLGGISELKNELEKESTYSGLRLTNGFVVGMAFEETKDFEDELWGQIINTKRVPRNNVDRNSLEVKTNLVLNQDVIDGIDRLKQVLPKYLPEISYVTTSYVIRVVVRAALLNRDKKLN